MSQGKVVEKNEVSYTYPLFRKSYASEIIRLCPVVSIRGQLHLFILIKLGTLRVGVCSYSPPALRYLQ
jgi:hypothetical protein